MFKKSLVLAPDQRSDCKCCIIGMQCCRGAIIRLEAACRHRLAYAGEAACRPAVECYRRR